MTEQSGAQAAPPLAKYRWVLVGLVGLVAAWGFFAAGAQQFGWTTFWAVGFAANGGLAVLAVQAFFPLLNVIAFPLLSLLVDQAGLYGYLIGAAALAAWLLAQRRRRDP